MTAVAALTILVVVRTREPHRQAEALRAALGLTLRGARVEVALSAPPATPLAHRAADTLRSFGHPVELLPGDPPDPTDAASDAASDAATAAATTAALAAAMARASRVEVWT